MGWKQNIRAYQYVAALSGFTITCLLHIADQGCVAIREVELHSQEASPLVC